MKPMESRVTRLEVEFEHVRESLGEIKVEQRRTVDLLQQVQLRLAELPTKRDLTNNVFASLAIGLAIMGIVIGGIIGGLAWLAAR